ncbi:MAG: 3-phosphoshikimate 1-carboxyvinyltransferase [Bacteroidetes bacterium]|nr:3-phosphoshikimate 1-carboxyvinyltransferase [Bacteroidota bacterium]
MQSVTIQPGPIQGNLIAPASKSFSQRVLAALLVRGGNLLIRNPGTSSDERIVRKLLKEAGYTYSVTLNNDLYFEAPENRLPIKYADFGSSALAARMLTPLLALQPHVVRLDGTTQLCKRPLPFLNTWLPQLGVRVAGTGGYLPASIQGPLKPRDIQIDASLSSQALSGLLLAYSATNATGTIIEVQNLVSKPYIDLTLHVLELMGMLTPTHEDYHRFMFPASNPGLEKSAQIHIEGDWSGAAFLLVAGAIGGKVCIQGLDKHSKQADLRILEALKQCGAGVSETQGQICVVKVSPLRAFHFDANECPDLFPPLAVLACYAQGQSSIQGVERLLYKESNRAISITGELQKMGAEIHIEGDAMVVEGGRQLAGTLLHSHEDHRIAMMCALAAIGADGPVQIQQAMAVDKSFPDFYEMLHHCGLQIAYGK